MDAIIFTPDHIIFTACDYMYPSDGLSKAWLEKVHFIAMTLLSLILNSKLFHTTQLSINDA